MASLKGWVGALRLRTLPLALSSVGMGGFLAASMEEFNARVFALCCSTTILLQILSNLANDYGDYVHGVDHSGRVGPARALQSGGVSKAGIKAALVVATILCLASGIWMLALAVGWASYEFFVFLALGFLAIVAAVAYTMGKRPYGYLGFGDASVMIFFGLVGVLGSFYLQAHRTEWSLAFPAVSCGLLSMGVLNINNIRDMESDRVAGKFSVPVRLGRERAVVYHWFLLGGSLACALVYTLLHFGSWHQFLFLLAAPLIIRNGYAVQSAPTEKLDPWLRQLALSTLLFVVLFGAGLLIR